MGQNHSANPDHGTWDKAFTRGGAVLRDRVRFQGRAGLNIGLDTSTGPYLAKGPNSKVLPNSRVELDSRTGSMGTDTTGSKWEWDQTPAKVYIPTD